MSRPKRTIRYPAFMELRGGQHVLTGRVLGSADLRRQVVNKRALRATVRNLCTLHPDTLQANELLRMSRRKRAAAVRAFAEFPPFQFLDGAVCLHSLVAAAVHEAGHAVIGSALGVPCAYVTVVPQLEKPESGCAAVLDPEQLWRIGERLRGPDAARTWHMMVLMAGAEAERELFQRESKGDGGDLKSLLLIDGSTPERLARGRRHAVRLVYRHRAAVERVASALVEYGALHVDEIDEAMAGAWNTEPIEVLLAREEIVHQRILATVDTRKARALAQLLSDQ